VIEPRSCSCSSVRAPPPPPPSPSPPPPCGLPPVDSHAATATANSPAPVTATARRRVVLIIMVPFGSDEAKPPGPRSTLPVVRHRTGHPEWSWCPATLGRLPPSHKQLPSWQSRRRGAVRLPAPSLLSRTFLPLTRRSATALAAQVGRT